ncbi:aminoacyl-tRNA hydrolase [Patescibacteria group bacterium]|nr:aminoacyl-tRNA hydrolase [Patescibacteria group bacterium]
MYLIVGLGNPGKKYAKTRHNVGFLVLDEFQKKYGFPEFSLSKKHASLVSEGILNETKVVLAKPQTFMNNSGKAVRSLLPKSRLGAPKRDLGNIQNLIVIHDDIDIPLGKVKVSENRGSAGHKGVDSVIQALRTKNFTRMRVGIQPAKGKPSNVETFVLKPFSQEEKALLKSSIAVASQAILKLLEQ